MSAANEKKMPRKRKLIEVALPLDVINQESAREKSIRHGHPSTLHLWWARRPLAAARAVLFAQLVDDPSSHPEKFPTEADQQQERARLFQLIERMVPWEATRNDALLREVRDEIAKSCGSRPPAILDPFAGGGTIPLEAQRLGLEAHASDLNPVPVLINKALIEIPPKWVGQKPVSPNSEIRGDWSGTSGLAEDVRRYGEWMSEEAFRRIGGLYPQARLPDGTQAPVIAWLWARTVVCPNPACGAEMPLVSTWWLSKKRDRPRWLEPIVAGKQIRFEIRDGKVGPQDPPKQGRGAKFACLVCGTVTTDAYVKAEGAAGRMGARLLAIVAEGKRQRIYLEATDEHTRAAILVTPPDDVPQERLPLNARWFSPPFFGLETYDALFTPRQLIALTTLSELVREAQARATADAIASGMIEEHASSYGEAIATYLGFAVSRMADYASTITTWANNPKMELLRNAFARQALPMTWDYAEGNIFGPSSGTLDIMVRAISRALESLPSETVGIVRQENATEKNYSGYVVATDPPYYDNIGYADLSDFFYVWLRRSLGSIYPDIMNTILTPKNAELIASPYRHGGSRTKAEHHFERGFVETFTRIREDHPVDFPLTVFYAFKQSETDEIDGTASTGWETMLNGLIEAGLMVTATWPVRTERAGRSIGIGTNALASSIVLACRPRPTSAGTTDRRGFLGSLRRELPRALRELQEGNIAPVDMAQSAIGPGIAIYSRYAKVTEANGTPMRVRTALALINDVLAEVLSEQEGDFDLDTRWCVKWFEQFQWESGKFGDAETLSKAYNTSVRGLEDAGVVASGDSKVRLVGPADLPSDYDPILDSRLSSWEVMLHISRVLEGKGLGAGVDAAGELLARARQRGDIDEDAIKELAYLLYSVCERNGWSDSAQRFNNLVSSWSDLQTAARAAERHGPHTPREDQLF